MAKQAEATSPDEGFAAQFLMMGQAFLASSERNRLFIICAALAVVIGGTAYTQVWLNAWNEPFYNALAARNLAGFITQLGVFAIIAGILLALNVAQTWLTLASKLRLRQGLVQDLFHEWLTPGRAVPLSTAGEIGINPDQRLHEDARQLSELTADLGIGLFQSTLLLLSFIGVLWGLSRGAAFHVHGTGVDIPGYLVWWALLYAGAASWLSWLVGRPLIRLNAERYAREADLRFSLVRTSESVDSIAIYGGEADEERRLRRDLEGVLSVLRRIVAASTRLRWVTAGYGWFTLVAPIIAAAPAYFSGLLSFGELMVAAGAFNQVQQALRWFVDNFSVIADWRATLVRVATFRSAVVGMDQLDHGAPHIELAASPDDRIAFTGLEVATPGGAVSLEEESVTIEPGERVEIVAGQRVGKTMLFRAIAGLWPWGAGKISLPPRQTMAFMPRRPYVPPGLLKGALAYPSPPETFSDADYAASLRHVGLGRLAKELDRNARWDRELSEDEQQALAFARLCLHKPRFIVTDDTLDTLEPARRRLVKAMLDKTLKDSAIVNIGDVDDRDFVTRTLKLVKDPEGRSFIPPHHKGPVEHAAVGVPETTG